jgi:hypothetical protein
MNLEAFKQSVDEVAQPVPEKTIIPIRKHI